MKKNKPFWYICWVEGLTLKTGEKLASFTSLDVDDREYTVKMTEALRVEPDILTVFSNRIARAGIKATFHRTNYAPAGTIWKPF